jgi:dTDP-4-amino-4,6-dideoxygalactose transaminase
MKDAGLAQDAVLVLPSDQDASGRTLGEEELTLLAAALRSGTLTSTKGAFVKTLEQQFAETLGVQYAYACASGTSAIHTAIAAINPEPGEEIITSPITDMGALAPILYQGAIPVFADVDPQTCNVTASTIAACLSDRTRAIIVTHLFGNPCDMDGILALAQAHHLPVIEDCAQAFLARYNGNFVGTLGTIGCFSLQQGKHITTGEGGLVVTNDAAMARHMCLFINKAWGYGDVQPDHYFLALNARMSELQGAVAVGQLPKLGAVVEQRMTMASMLTEQLQDVPGVETPVIKPQSVHVYWKYCLRIDERLVPGGAMALARLLREKGISSVPRYIQKPAFMCEVFAKQRTFGNSHYPFTLARPEAVNYERSRFPGTFKALEDILVLPWNERYSATHVSYIADAIRQAVAVLQQRRA